MALTADTLITFEGESGREQSVPVRANAVVYLGALVSADADGDAGPSADTAGQQFVGIAQEAVDNTGGADGAVNVRVVSEGRARLTSSSLTKANINDTVYAAADDSVATSTTNSIKVGHIARFISATEAVVDFRPHGQI